MSFYNFSLQNFTNRSLGTIEVPAPRYVGLLDLQLRLEGVIESIESGVYLAMDMKQDEISLEGLNTLVRLSIFSNPDKSDPSI
jgi:hypothetical protein